MKEYLTEKGDHLLCFKNGIENNVLPLISRVKPDEIFARWNERRDVAMQSSCSVHIQLKQMLVSRQFVASRFVFQL